MAESTTQDQLIKFIYGELSFDEIGQLYDQLDQDREAMKSLHELVDAKEQLDQQKLKPSHAVIERILNYSNNYAGSNETLC